RFFVRLYRNDAAGLAPSKEFLCKMTEKMQADVPPSRQAGFVRCCLYIFDRRKNNESTVFDYGRAS
ncbi:MAG: hypothetical protein IKN55_06440, partial [Oscillospiraceae bacterium]|nr:hypothetical protein [Oscillospiraceae bacterium]